jgi:hypothetical protein
MKTPITPIRLPLELKTAFKKRAEKEGTNLSQLMIKATSKYCIDVLLAERKEKLDKGYLNQKPC